jgi:hypothetical protein
MTTRKFTLGETTQDIREGSATRLLGVNKKEPYSQNDVGKSVKLVGNGRFGLCADGEEIEGFITSVEPYTTEGYAVGSVRRRMNGKLVYTTGPIALGDQVVSAAQTAVGVKVDAKEFGYPTVKRGTPATHKWRVLWLSNAGDNVAYIEKV